MVALRTLPCFWCSCMVLLPLSNVSWAAPDNTAAHEQPASAQRAGGVAHARQRLDQLAAALEIRATQQAAWDDYARAVLAMPANLRAIKTTPAPTDAAAIARARADHASAMAAELKKIADAAERLQAVLTPEQQAVFNQMAGKPGHPHHPHHGRHSDSTVGAQKH